MKKIILLLFLLLVFNSHANKFKIAKIESAPGLAFNGKLLEEIYKRADLKLEFVTLPGKRALIESSTGRIDGELSRIYEIGQEYPTLKRVPTPYGYVEPTAFTKKLNFTVSGWDSLKGYKIGVVIGIKFAELGTANQQNVSRVPRNELLFRMLERDRLDLIVMSKFNGLFYAKKFGLDSVYPLKPALERIHVFHYLHEKHKDIVPKLDMVIKAMKKSGELEKLREEFMQEILENGLEK